MTLNSPPASVDLLILGGGWTYTFLEPLLVDHHSSLTYAATTRDGRGESIKWTWDETMQGQEQYEILPRAKTVIIVFPIKGVGGSKRLVERYEAAIGAQRGEVRWIQLGSSGIWDGGPTLREKRATFEWTDRHSPYALENARAIAEDELLSTSNNVFVLNLSGLWGGDRDPINWITRVAPTKEALATKSSVHLIHGLDVARAIVAVHLSPPVTSLVPSSSRLLGQRYLLTDLRVYDWWDIISAWGLAPTKASSSLLSFASFYSPGESGGDLLGPQPAWVLELMEEQSVRALPRTPETLGRALDSRDFWKDFKLMPIKGRLERGRL